jgi:hypothetical protein
VNVAAATCSAVEVRYFWALVASRHPRLSKLTEVARAARWAPANRNWAIGARAQPQCGAAPTFRSWYVGETPLSCVAQQVVAVFFGEALGEIRVHGTHRAPGIEMSGNPMVIGQAPHHCECGIPNRITLDPIAAAGLASI